MENELPANVLEQIKIDAEAYSLNFTDSFLKATAYNTYIEAATAYAQKDQEKGTHGGVWVKASERLPEANQIVMLYNDGLFLLFFKFWPVGYNGNDEAIFIGMNNKGPYGLDEVTHWAPLPFGPNESGNHYQELKEKFNELMHTYDDQEKKLKMHEEALEKLHTDRSELKEKAERMETSFTDLKKYCDNAKEWVFDKEGKAIVSVVSNMVGKALNGGKEGER